MPGRAVRTLLNVEMRELTVSGAFEVSPKVHGDNRGVFLEWFRADRFAETTGHRFTLAQANASVSSVGTVRGVHYAQLPPSQAKWVTCLTGAVFDVVVDLRLGSPTFAAWDAVALDDTNRRALYLSEGLGHAFVSLEDASVVSYLCSAPYAPAREHAVHPLDPAIGIEWPTVGRGRVAHRAQCSPTRTRTHHAGRRPSRAGMLPQYDEARAYYESLRD